MANYTDEDKLVLQELWLADANSTLNSEETEVTETTEEEVTEVEETNEETLEDTEEVSEDEEELEEHSAEWEQKQKKPNKIAKILSQKNQAKEEANYYKKQAEDLQDKLQKLQEWGEFWTEEYIETLIQKTVNEREALNEYFEQNPEIKQYKNEILEYSKNTNLSIDKATKLYLAENNPTLLLDEQTRNKNKSKMYQTKSIVSKDLGVKKYTFDDAEFETMAKKWLIKF